MLFKIPLWPRSLLFSAGETWGEMSHIRDENQMLCCHINLGKKRERERERELKNQNAAGKDNRWSDVWMYQIFALLRLNVSEWSWRLHATLCTASWWLKSALSYRFTWCHFHQNQCRELKCAFCCWLTEVFDCVIVHSLCEEIIERQAQNDKSLLNSHYLIL